MRINNITIKAFRGFEDEHFVFDPKVNVVLGNNTTGKTTLLHAVQIALGAYLQAMTLIPGGKFFSRNYQKSDYVRKYSEASKSFLPDINKPSIRVSASFTEGRYHKASGDYQSLEKEISWLRTGAKNSQKNTGELLKEIADMERQRRNADADGVNSVFPLMLSFGASRLQNSYNGAEKTKARASREEKAYKCALDEQVDFKGAFDWIYRFEKNLEKNLEFQGTDIAFITALKEAVPALKEIDIDRKNCEFTAQIQMTGDASPRWLTYDMMSDGFKAMINIAAEIAHRCVELNGFLGADAVTKTPGIVMIDELDLYLHPHWQQHVLADLQRAFPLFQFIVTTHSPFIVQSVESHNVITLDGTKGYNDPNKRSLEEIVVSEMNMDTVRSAKYNRMLENAEQYYRLVKSGAGDTPEAATLKTKLDELEAQFSDDPAYVALLRAERNSQ